MKHIILAILCAVFAFAVFGRAVSTRWEPGPHKHPHGVGLRCPYCTETFGAIPKGLKAWEVRHLLKVRRQVYALHLKLRHGIGR